MPGVQEPQAGHALYILRTATRAVRNTAATCDADMAVRFVTPACHRLRLCENPVTKPLYQEVLH